MLRADKGALVCDLAETYGIYDYESLPVSLLATLAAGLRDNSRSKMKISGKKITRTEAMLAAALDRLSRIAWLLSFVCPHEGEPPKSILNALMGEEKEKAKHEVEIYDSPEAFDAEWRRRTGEGHGAE